MNINIIKNNIDKYNSIFINIFFFHLIGKI